MSENNNGKGVIQAAEDIVVDVNKLVRCAPLELVKIIKNKVDNGYLTRDDYPPFAIDMGEDRRRYKNYIFNILDEVLIQGHA